MGPPAFSCRLPESPHRFIGNWAFGVRESALPHVADRVHRDDALYGILAYSVGERTREFGIRLALGAEPSSPLLAVVGQGIGMSVTGVRGNSGSVGGRQAAIRDAVRHQTA